MSINGLQVGMAALGALGFALLFEIRGWKLLYAMLGGACTWLIVLALASVCAEPVRYLAASAFASLYAELLARAVKTPATVFCVPGIVPLVPGASLFSAMNAALRSDWTEFARASTTTVTIAVSIAGGVLISVSAMSLLRSIRLPIHRKGTNEIHENR